MFGDYARGCIWYLPAGAGGVPDSGNPQILVNRADGPVDMFTGNGGTLFYVGIGLDGYQTGSIHRITYDGGRPTAKIATANGTKPYGSVSPDPLVVDFDASATTDPDQDPATLSYTWSVTGAGATKLADTGRTARYRFTQVRDYTVTVTVRDAEGNTDTASIKVSAGNNPPDLAIYTPDADLRWAVGQKLNFSGAAIDPEDGELAASKVDWSVTMEHCPASCHSHPLLEAPGTRSGSVTTIDHELPSYILLRISATDSRGLTATMTRRVNPAALRVVFGTTPGGLRLSVNGRERSVPRRSG